MSEQCKNTGCSRQGIPKKGMLCHTCYSRKDKKRNPFSYYFNMHKNNARRRGIPWEMTLEEFKRLWKESGKWEQKLKQTEDTRPIWTIDRKDVNLGYTFDNCQIIEKSLNVQLWYKRDRWNIRFRWRKRWADNNGTVIEEAPF